MAEAVFFFQGEFCHCFSELWQQKNRIVAKAAAAAFFGNDLAFAKAFGKMRFTVWNGNRNRGMEARSPWTRFVLEILYQDCAAFCIGDFLSIGRAIACRI